MFFEKIHFNIDSANSATFYRLMVSLPELDNERSKHEILYGDRTWKTGGPNMRLLASMDLQHKYLAFRLLCRYAKLLQIKNVP
jgi:hypothetical protein